MPYCVGEQGVCASLVGLYKPEEYGVDKSLEPLVCPWGWGGNEEGMERNTGE